MEEVSYEPPLVLPLRGDVDILTVCAIFVQAHTGPGISPSTWRASPALAKMGIPLRLLQRHHDNNCSTFLIGDGKI